MNFNDKISTFYVGKIVKFLVVGNLAWIQKAPWIQTQLSQWIWIHNKLCFSLETRHHTNYSKCRYLPFCFWPIKVKAEI